MRISLAITALLTTPVLLLTACGTDGTYVKPLKGTVIEKEYEPAKTKKTKVPVTRRICATTPAKVKKNGKTTKNKRTCTSAATGRTRTVTTTVRKECYELDIRLPNGTETEVCDKYAFYALIPGDRYSSAVDYSKKAHR